MYVSTLSPYTQNHKTLIKEQLIIFFKKNALFACHNRAITALCDSVAIKPRKQTKGIIMKKYTGFTHSGKVCTQTAGAADAYINGLVAESDGDAIRKTAAAIWERCDWQSQEECERHLFEHFCAY